MRRPALVAAASAVVVGTCLLAIAGGEGGKGGGTGERLLTVEPRKVTIQMVEFGEVESRQVLSVLAPITSEVTWVAEEGTLVKAGDPVLRMNTEALETSLEADRKANVGKEGELVCRRLQLAATEKSRKAAVLRAKIDLDTARNTLAEARSHPTPEEKRLAGLDLAEAKLRVEQATENEGSLRALAAKGFVAEAQAKAARLSLVREQASLARTEAAVRETLSGAAPERLRALEVAGKKAEMQLARAESAAEDDVAVARKSLAALETGYQVLTERLKNTEKSIASATVGAPDAGAVALIDVYKGSPALSPVQVGESHTRGRELLKIAAVSSPRVLAHISEVDIARVAVGQPAEVRLRSDPGRALKATVAEIAVLAEDKNRKLGSLALDKSGEAGVNSVDVRLDLEVPANEPIPRLGSSAEVRIAVATYDQALAVPLAALRWKKSGDSAGPAPFLNVLHDGQVQTVPVKIAAVSGNDAVVAEGLAAGDKVVLEEER
jgi:membrane fusion protein, macrolide-specific efflux system